MSLEYISALLEEAVASASPLDVRGRVVQVVGTIIRAVVPGVRVGEICLLRNPHSAWELKAEVVGFARKEAILTPLGNLQGIAPDQSHAPRREGGARANRPVAKRVCPLDARQHQNVAKLGRAAPQPQRPCRCITQNRAGRA
jgi:flagellar biosynthesis/type III secretory pathway ATPase